ncbi:RIP metalloprotease RseP [Tahibacter amnicola]|uniref:Zinc metalloprotease n=1 Tax=Tahibacter amnicola TaxID=2976241 RepID=A0ABY6BCF3_9GAMM|nr:RIP metalloprotease RseP [Tahibacter amnicola]UXI66800.1 RIP metalloprotease RseP [Tahibacter amnicola]
MGDFFGSIWWLLVTLGLLITFHEFGHYSVARLLGVKVLRFSVGFGKPIWTRVARNGTEFVISLLPLGGYVKFLDSREAEVSPEDADGDFNSKAVWKRAAITVAGPLFNLIFTIAALWAMFIIGKADYQPVIGKVDGVSATAGFAAGDTITKVGVEPVQTLTDAGFLLLGHAMDRGAVDVTVTDAQGKTATRRLDTSGIPRGIEEVELLRQVGITWRPFLPGPAQFSQVSKDSPAAAAGFKAGDRVVSVNEIPISDSATFVETVQKLASAQTPLSVVVQRGTERQTLTVTPKAATSDEGPRWQIGVTLAAPPPVAQDALLRYGPIAALGAAFRETASLTGRTLAMLKRMIVGSASLKNISGPISIAQTANASAQLGAGWFLYFLALISLSLCIMNLLPIPILDGGHLVYYLIESVKGSPVSERMLIAGQYAGLVLLAALMGLAFYNDIVRQLPS